MPDFAICRANGQPLYTLVNPVDDALMGITHVLRGEDLLSSTPRQIALYDALEEVGLATATPRFGHLPYVMGQGNKKLSKRDPEANLLGYREDGFLPEGLLNYLALLGWAIAADRDVFTVPEMVEAFDIGDVNPNPARFDLKKAEAINADHMRMLSIEELTHRVVPFLQAAGVVTDPVDDADAQLLELAMPLVAERMNKLTEAAADARLPVRRRGVVRAGRRARRRRPRRRTRGARGAVRARVLVDRRHRGRAARGADREARAQAAGGVRPGPDRGHRPEGVAAAVRVAGAPGPRPLAGAPGCGSRLMEGPNYHLVQRLVGRWAVWRPIVGLVALVALMVIAQFVLLVGFAVVFLATGADVGDKLDALSDTAHVTPSQLAYLNLSLAAAIPVAMLLTRVLHGMRPGWVSSVIGRLRWRWMAVTFGLAFVALLATVVVGVVRPVGR